MGAGGPGERARPVGTRGVREGLGLAAADNAVVLRSGKVPGEGGAGVGGGWGEPLGSVARRGSPECEGEGGQCRFRFLAGRLAVLGGRCCGCCCLRQYWRPVPRGRDGRVRRSRGVLELGVGFPVGGGAASPRAQGGVGGEGKARESKVLSAPAGGASWLLLGWGMVSPGVVVPAMISPGVGTPGLVSPGVVSLGVGWWSRGRQGAGRGGELAGVRGGGPHGGGCVSVGCPRAIDMRRGGRAAVLRWARVGGGPNWRARVAVGGGSDIRVA